MRKLTLKLLFKKVKEYRMSSKAEGKEEVGEFEQLSRMH